MIKIIEKVCVVLVSNYLSSDDVLKNAYVLKAATIFENRSDKAKLHRTMCDRYEH